MSVGGYCAFVVYGYRSREDRVLLIGWTFIAALAAALLVGLDHARQPAVPAAADRDGRRRRRRRPTPCRAVARFIRAEFRELGGVFLVVLALVVAATLASALAWSGVGLIAFVPLVGLAVFPLQIAALLVRGLVFEYIGLTALGAYLTLYRRHVRVRAAAGRATARISAAVGRLTLSPSAAGNGADRHRVGQRRDRRDRRFDVARHRAPGSRPYRAND